MSSAIYDVVVIGGGSGGYAAARTAAALGARVGVVEGGREMGGLCILRGCMPTKALLESAHRSHEIGRAAEFGIDVGKPRPDWERIVDRKDAFIRDFAGYRRQQLEKGKFDLIRGRARFIDARRIMVDPLKTGGRRRELASRTFILATGSVIERKPIPGLWETGCLTSDEAIHLRRPPKSLVVLGGGPIACEFAQYFHHLGVRTTLLQRSRQLLSGHDADTAGELEKTFRREGMEVLTGTQLLQVSRHGNGKRVSFEQDGKRRHIDAGEILYALGRIPAVAGLGLESAGVALRGLAVQTGPTMQTTCKHIFAVGDVTGPYEVVHTAITQGEAAARNALKFLRGTGKLERVDYTSHMEVVFTSPEVASIGLSEKEALAEKVPFLSAKYPFNDHGKSLIMGAREGFVKILADPAKGRILGAQIVGPHASDLIHEFAALMHFKATVHDLIRIPHYHPTLGEIVTYPAEEIADQLTAN
ncbi:MAG: dihydrolipoyl dehydrogenase [Candidatus Methylacidiphilales bacterium]|nr:dihydrolipoyl dehydrogenase [Candidatus Methylacidiphilales bacterium]